MRYQRTPNLRFYAVLSLQIEKMQLNCEAITNAFKMVLESKA